MAFKVTQDYYSFTEGVIFKILSCLQLPGLLSLSTKFLPTVMNLLKKLAEEGQGQGQGQGQTNGEPQRNPTLAAKSFRSSANDHGGLSSTGSSEVTSENGDELSSPTFDRKVK